MPQRGSGIVLPKVFENLKWFNVNQLALALDVSNENVHACVKRMRKYSELNEKAVRLQFKRNVSRDVLHFSFKV